MKSNILLFPMLLLAGCATPPAELKPDLPTTIPAAYQKAGADNNKPVRSGWYQSFDDEQLEKLLPEALAANPQIQAAAARLKQAQATAKRAGAGQYPELDLAASGARSQSLTRTTGATPDTFDRFLRTRSSQLGVSLDLSWELDLWGRLGAAKSASLADVQAGADDLKAARLSLAGQTAKGWFLAVESKLQHQLAADTAQSFKSNTDIVRKRYEQGLGAALDLRLAETSEHNAAALEKQTKLDYENSVRSLEILLGRYPSTELAVADTLVAVPPPVPAGLPSELLERRPDIQAAERRLAAADRRIREARAAQLPRISLTASGGTSSDALRDLVDPKHLIWGIAANFLQPLFDAGKLSSDVDLSKAKYAEQLANYVDVSLRAFREVEDALAGENLLAEREQELQLSAQAARSAYTMAEEKYKGGLSDILTVLQSQRNYIDAQRAYLQIKRLRLENRVNLHLALGGDFSPTPAEPAHN